VDAKTVNWTGASTNLPHRWDDPHNWNPSVPEELDDVVIDQTPYDPQPRILVDAAIKLHSLSMTRMTLVTVNADATVDILNLSGEITGPANLTIRTQFLWTEGTLSGTGEVISEGQLTIEDPPSGAAKSICGRTLRNKLKALWRSGDLSVTDGGRIINELTGEFTIGDLADKRMAGSYLDSGGFFNAGALKLVRENGFTTSIYCPFSNSNRVDYGTQLLLFGGGIHSGAFLGDSWGRLQMLSGTNYLDEGFVSTCWNTVRVGGGLMHVRGLSKMDRLQLDGGNLDGPGDLELSDGMLWTSGNIAGSGVLRILQNIFYIGPNNSPRELIGKTVEVFGVANWESVNFAASEGAILRIMPTARLNMASAQALQQGSGARCRLDNYGLMGKSGMGATYIGIDVINHGSFGVGSGKIQCGGGFIQESGSTQISSELQVDKGMTNQYAGEISGYGKLSGNLVNYGTLRPGAYPPGILTIGGLTQKESGRIEVDLEWVDPGSGYDQLRVEGSAVLDGTIEIKLRNYFKPRVGSRFDVLTCLSRSGEFKITNGNYVDNNVALIPEYDAAKVTLATTAITTEFPTLSLVQTLDNGNGLWSWPATAGRRYQIESSADLIGWLVFSNVTATASMMQLELPIALSTEPARFYRVH
jgi:hypothetical protein